MSIAGSAHCAPEVALLHAPRLRARAARVLLLAFVAGLLSACTRASAAALLPTISLGVLARRAVQLTSSEAVVAERWHAVALVALQFRPRSVAAELPLRAELMPETWIAPCDAEDFVCLEEAAEAEQELRNAFGELQ
jgi:hypothetical protein